MAGILWKRKYLECVARDERGRLIHTGIGIIGTGIGTGHVIALLLGVPLLPCLVYTAVSLGHVWIQGVLVYIGLMGVLVLICGLLGYDPDQNEVRHLFLADGRFVARMKWMFLSFDVIIVANHDAIVSIERGDHGAVFVMIDGQRVSAVEDDNALAITTQLNRAFAVMRHERPPSVLSFGGSPAPVRRPRLVS